MKEIKFIAWITPKGKERPRFHRIGKSVVTYTTRSTMNYEKTIKEAFLEAGGEKFDAPYLEVDINAFFAIPKQTRKAERLLLETEIVPYNKKIDADNIAKAILDALNGIAYEDDKQVTSLKVNKYYGRTNRLEIRIKEINV